MKIFDLMYYLKFQAKANFAHLERILHIDKEGEVDRLQNALLVQRVLHLFQFHHLKYIPYFRSKLAYFQISSYPFEFLNFTFSFVFEKHNGLELKSRYRLKWFH